MSDLDETCIDFRILDDGLEGSIESFNLDGIHSLRSIDVVHAENVCIFIALLLESLVVVRELTSGISDLDTVTCNGSDDLELAGLRLGLSVTEGYNADINESACDHCESVGFL